MYMRKRVFFRTGSIEVIETHTGKYGAPGMRRAKRKKPTPEQMAKQNQWKKERAIRWLLKENFDEYDYWITLTYSPGNRPLDLQTAKKQVQKFLRQVKDQYRKRNRSCKYIVATEVGSRGGIHHHIVMNRIEGGDILLRQKWTHGNMAMSLLYGRGGYKKLADYIAKQPAKDNSIKEKWYSRSRNLKQPKIEKRPMLRRTFTKEPFIPKGYYLDKESVYAGVNPVTGHLYRYYTLIKLDRRC